MRNFYTAGLLVLLPAFLAAQITLQLTVTPVSCFGGNNGTAKVTPTGGTTPYTFHWTTGETTDAITSLAMGTYTVTVTDNNGITASKSVEITQPPLLGATLNGQPQICTVAPDGFTYVIPTGGTPPHTFSWSNDAHTQLNNHLTANSYTVTVTDNRGCTASGSYTVGFLGLGLYLFTDSEKAVCPQPDNGSASVKALSGNGPYQYLWSTSDTTTAIHGLQPGIYGVTVSDVNGCSAASAVTVDRKDTDPAVVEILIPQCTNQTYNYESTDGYHVYHWALNDQRDSIVSGNGTKKIQVKWGAQGPKEVSVAMSDTITQCATGTLFKVVVYECSVGTSEAVWETLTVAPNPFDQYIRIDGMTPENPNSTIELFDLQGKLMARQSLSAAVPLIDTHNILPGVYLLKISGDHSAKVWKMIK